MPRATNGPASRKRRKRILLRAKGFRGFRSKLFRYAKDAVYKAWQYEYLSLIHISEPTRH